jgi:AraC-like DNA-binding protein
VIFRNKIDFLRNPRTTMKTRSTVSITMIHALSMYASRIGVDVSSPYQNAGIQSVLLDDPEIRIPAVQFHDLWLEIASSSGDLDFGLHFAETSRNQLGDDFLAAVMFNCPTVGLAMEKLIRYHALTTDVIQIQHRSGDDQASYTWETFPADYPLDRHIAEAVTSRIYFTLENLSRGRIRFVEIRFSHSRPESISEHNRIFACPLIFDRKQNEIIIQQEGLELPIPLANPKLLEPLEAIAQNLLNELFAPDTWAERVIHLISKTLLDGQKPSLERIAHELTVSTRHLQNKLRAEDVTYRTLLDQVRKEMALGYLKEPGINIFDTAFLLGFSDQSSFNHAFKRWTGMTPGEFRNGTRNEYPSHGPG